MKKDLSGGAESRHATSVPLNSTLPDDLGEGSGVRSESSASPAQHPFFADWEHPVFDGPNRSPKKAWKPHNLRLNTEADE